MMSAKCSVVVILSRVTMLTEIITELMLEIQICICKKKIPEKLKALPVFKDNSGRLEICICDQKPEPEKNGKIKNQKKKLRKITKKQKKTQKNSKTEKHKSQKKNQECIHRLISSLFSSSGDVALCVAVLLLYVLLDGSISPSLLSPSVSPRASTRVSSDFVPFSSMVHHLPVVQTQRQTHTDTSRQTHTDTDTDKKNINFLLSEMVLA